MIVINYFKQYKFPLLFLLVVIVYFFLYGPVGYDDADNGYTLALSWRIINGEIPYRDFILVRPPLSPYLHALPLYFIPDNYQIIFDRFLFYVITASSCFFAAFSIKKVFQFSEIIIDPYLLATIGFVFSVNTFPAMAWHAVDGVFFGSLGIFFLVRFSSCYSIVLGILFLFLSALCKQPFYLMPFMGIAYIFLLYKKWDKRLTAILTLLLGGIIFILLFYKLGILKSFISLTTGSTTLNALIDAGFKQYRNFNLVYVLLPFAMWIVAFRFRNNRIKSYTIELVPYFFILILFLFPLYLFLPNFYTVRSGGFNVSFICIDMVGRILFDVTIIFLILNVALTKKWITLILLTGLAWCSSISWGFQTPAFFCTPLIFTFLLVAKKYFTVKRINILGIYMLLVGSLAYFCTFQKPHLNPLRKDIIYSLDDLFPKLKNIKVGKDTYYKYHELHNLINKYGNNFKTLPGMPLANYLTNTNSPIVIDWVFNAETGFYNNQIINTLQNKNTIIFMETPCNTNINSDTVEKSNSYVAYVIKTKWIKVDSSSYFGIYKFKK